MKWTGIIPALKPGPPPDRIRRTGELPLFKRMKDQRPGDKPELRGDQAVIDCRTRISHMVAVEVAGLEVV